MKQKLRLLKNCVSTYPSVTPKNWKTGGKELLNKIWVIHFYFKDPDFAEKYPRGKQVRIKGMNEFKTLGERREATQILLDGIVHKLVNKNWNPIKEEYMESNELEASDSLIEALKFYSQRKIISKSYHTDIRSMIKYLEISIKSLQLQFKPVNTISRRDIKAILRHQQESRGLTNNRYNKYKAILSSLFDDMIEDEVIEHNPTYKIKKLITDTKVREVLSDDERHKVYVHLKENYYTFWRFMMIFYSSGARIRELLAVKVKDVNLHKLEYKVFVRKGQLYKEVVKPINKNYAYLWVEVINEQNTERLEINPNHYLFSYNLSKGSKEIRYEQITRRWREHVKKKLGISADFYALKHLYSDQISAQLDVQHAQRLNSHTSDRMVLKHYAVNEEQRKINRLKNIDTPFYKDNNKGLDAIE